ncbi:DMT family transporter [Thalassomonas haliotis]|uniref:DMT family transporter n=1 Tax=Thalassomonas haliotis TaxID=485448 RepID=A0ABY7VHG9_9GAMM|nr:DMT family transporter [Thalassomonas haliotis]WDE12476.1 DMT family transporter [Thalassomonas haliotis]
MSVASLIRLITLAAIWGGSFLFMRIAANPLGPAVLIEARVFFAAITLLVIALYLGKKLSFVAHSKHFFILGFFNSALPFLLFAYSAQVLNVSSLAVLNSTAPIWGAIIAAIRTKTALTKKVTVGLALGVVGVAILVGLDVSNIGAEAILPIIAATAASVSYGIATNYAKNAPQVAAFDNAHGSMWASAIIVLPLLAFFPVRQEPGMDIFTAVVLLGVVCTGIAYLLYFRLIADIGPSSALSVTFLIPVFGILWGHLFLGEAISLHTLIGSVLVIAGTMFVSGFSLRKTDRQKALVKGVS